MKAKKTYTESESTLEYATSDERELLELERAGKTKVEDTSLPIRTRVIHSVTEWYKRVLRNFLEHTWLRRLSIVIPFVFFLFGIIALAPRV